jgi:protein SCO1/2
MKSAVHRTGNWLLVLILAIVPLQAEEQHPASGLVLAVDQARHTITISCQEIPGYMDAIVMTLNLRGATPEKLSPGMNVDFTIIAAGDAAYADDIRIHPFESLELDPTQARRLHLIENLTAPATRANAIEPGSMVPDFTLTDQSKQSVTLSQFAGKVVALTFIYTRCPLPDYCFRLSNNFGQLQKRFRTRMGSDLILLSVVIDPAHDQPAALSDYARTWKADSRAWHFLTGPLPQIEQMARGFDMNFYPEEALYVHSFHTIVIDRQGKLVANLEGNSFSAKQLGDLVETVLSRN